MNRIIESSSPEETRSAGAELAATLKPGDTVALYGDLGAGKTVFVSGAVYGLGYKGHVTSPTFAIVNEYSGGRIPAAHFDMYRIKNEADLFSTGFYDYLDRGYVLFIEWSENIPYAIEDYFIRVKISGSGNTRRIEISDGRNSR
ncbi:MAG: tRNA (adenosine(37)-N6)-threonylcarbamoyltransferase complex ATPase subunit type 1 TsaE [Oscillospiraceae bacterium]|jgi:tRNA threonylcarbamoyladenosine biosynthesis protein TsaE